MTHCPKTDKHCPTPNLCHAQSGCLGPMAALPLAPPPVQQVHDSREGCVPARGPMSLAAQTRVEIDLLWDEARALLDRISRLRAHL